MITAAEPTMPSTTQQNNMAHHPGISPMDIGNVGGGGGTSSSSNARSVLHVMPNDGNVYGNNSDIKSVHMMALSVSAASNGSGPQGSKRFGFKF